jgi:hypothetical protein
MADRPDRLLTDIAAREILDRAIQLDARRAAGIDTAQLQAIASEIGVSPAALEQALAEHDAAAVPASVPADSRQLPVARGYRRILAVAAAMLLLLGLMFVFKRAVVEERASPSVLDRSFPPEAKGGPGR